MRFYKIPVFIPELACPHQCLFCNQKKITGALIVPKPEEVENIIIRYLSTIPEGNRSVEVAFYGGNFTGLPLVEQERFLAVASKFIAEELVQGIRISTRPDYITPAALDLLKRHGVSTIELGAQSLHDDVLAASGRGHTAADVVKASREILQHGFTLGLQMMTGLPGDTPEKSMDTARKIAALGAVETRIYPALVIRGTELEELFFQQKYKPQTLDDAVQLCARLKAFFDTAGITVLRMGLHPGEGLITGSDLAAGPFHPAFGELVKTKIWLDAFRDFTFEQNKGKPRIFVSPKEINAAIGHKGSNKKWLLEKLGAMEIKPDSKLTNTEMYVDYC